MIRTRFDLSDTRLSRDAGKHPDIAAKQVSLPRHGLGVVRGIELAKRLPEKKDGLGKIALFNDGFTPNGVDQIIPRYDLPAGKRQDSEHLQRLGGYRHELPEVRERQAA